MTNVIRQKTNFHIIFMDGITIIIEYNFGNKWSASEEKGIFLIGG